MTTDDRIRYLETELLTLAKDIATGRAGKIHAIKAYRSATGAALKDSKDWVEGLAALRVQEDTRVASLEFRVTEIERRMNGDLVIAGRER